MSNRTFVCRFCGGMRRSSAVYGSCAERRGAGPRCHEHTMEVLSNAQAAGAARLRKRDRLAWLAHGKRVVRRSGGRWEPVLTERDEKKADVQRMEHEAARTPPRPKPRWVRPRRRRG